jgi:hypothetical protein
MKPGSITRETVQIDSAKKFEEADTMLRKFREILIDHVQCRLEDGIEDRRYLRREERLVEMSLEWLS